MPRRQPSGSAPQDNGLDGLENDEEIEAEGEILDVVEIVLKLLQRVFDRRAIRVPDLCPSGEAWLDDVALAVEGDLLEETADEFGPLGARSHQAHVTTQD